MPELHDSTYLAAQGAIYVSPRTAAGAPVGYRFVGEVNSLTLAPNISRTDITENVTGSRAVGASFYSSVNFNLTMENRSIKPEHLALIMQGVDSPQTAASVTDQSHTAQQGMMIRLMHINVSNVVVTDDPDVTTYVEDTDYVVHAEAGLIEILSTGSITDDEALLIDYDYADQHKVTANPNNAAVSVLFAGVNMTNDERIRCEIYKCKLDAGSFDLINAEGASAQRNGVVELDTLRADGDQLFSWQVQ